MFGFKKKVEVKEFEATRSFMVDMLQYDALRRKIKLKGYKGYINEEDIVSYSLAFGSKTYTKKNLGEAAIGGALIGLAGVILAGSHQEEYVSNITVRIKTKDKIYHLPLTIGKMKMSAAKGILDSAEAMIMFLDEITKEEE